MSRRRILAALTALAVVVPTAATAQTADPVATAAAYTKCDDYTTQGEAQAAWEAAGRTPASADPDGDGVVCESLPASAPSTGDCTRKKQTVRVTLSRSRYPQAAKHVRWAVRHGYPKVLHIDRAGADENREQSIDHFEDTVGHKFSDAEREGRDRDEYPLAMSREGGLYKGRYAHVRLIDAAQNRGAGSSIGSQLRSYCDGQTFRVVVK